MLVRIGRCVCVLLLLVLGCARSPTPEPPLQEYATYQWFIGDSWSGPTRFGGSARPNLLVDPDISHDPDVLAASECVLRHALAGAPDETVCFICIGWDQNGAWLDPPATLLERLSDLGVALVPVSEASLRPQPVSSDGTFIPFQEPMSEGARCTLELSEWEAGVKAVVRVNVTFRKVDSSSPGGVGAVAFVHKVGGVWSVREWRGRQPWSPN